MTEDIRQQCLDRKQLRDKGKTAKKRARPLEAFKSRVRRGQDPRAAILELSNKL